MYLARPEELLAPVSEVARSMIGAQLRHGAVRLEVTEVEAYAGPKDTASHARFGRTERNASMWGPPGRLYVYLCYGVHNLVNVSTGAEGEASAVLIRSARVIGGDAIVQRRRGGRGVSAEICVGPGKVGQALALDRHASGENLCRRRGLELWLSDESAPLLCGPRVGIDFAAVRDRKRRWRFALADCAAVSHRKGLQKLRCRATDRAPQS